MTFDIPELKRSGKRALERAGEMPRRLVLLYVLVAAGVGILCNVLGWVLADRMDAATGLSGLGTRSALMAAQTIMNLAVTLASPLWDAGYSVSMLDVYRGKDAGPRRLLWGFVQWKRMLVCGVLLFVQFFAMSYLAVMVVEILYLFSPLSASLETAAAGDLAALNQAMLPVLILSGLAICAVMIFLVFRYQLVYYVMEDYPDIPGRRLLGASAVLIRGVKGQYLRLYLSYWWYYALYLVVSVVPYLDMLLELAGISLPVDGNVLVIGLYAVHMILLCGMQILWKNQIQCTLAAAYTQLRDVRMTNTAQP